MMEEQNLRGNPTKWCRLCRTMFHSPVSSRLLDGGSRYSTAKALRHRTLRFGLRPAPGGDLTSKWRVLGTGWQLEGHSRPSASRDSGALAAIARILGPPEPAESRYL